MSHMRTIQSSLHNNHMNHPITDNLPPPPPAFQPPRSSFTCDRHHNDNFTGFCPSCLSERLTILDQPPATADLRRTKSFSVSNTKQLPFLEPHRKSCDVNTLSSLFSVEDTSLNDLEHEIVEMETKIDQILDNMKSFNPDSNSKKSNFWSTATKKWKKWRKKSNAVVSSPTLPAKKKNRETQSEVADYGYGRRSCDIDTGRVSFDKPRASWDGYMIGRSFPRLNVNPPQRSDMQIPVERPANLGDDIPGGSIQTREYYLDSSSSSKRRKSLDRSNSIRKTTEVSNSKVSPGIMDYNHNHNHCRSRFHSIGGENELGTNFSSESQTTKKSRWWSWKALGFSNRKASNRSDSTILSRSSTSVSWRNTQSNPIEINSNSRRIGDEFVFERNASARYSPNHVNEGLLRFYLTPLRLRGSRQRTGTGTGTRKSRLF